MGVLKARSILKGASAALKAGASTTFSTNARAAATANEISAEAQRKQYEYNSMLMGQAAGINSALQANQQAFNQSQANVANSLNDVWYNQQMAYNAAEAQKAREFNAAEAEKQRQWTEKMSSTAIQRQMSDLKSAGLNPVLAASYMGANIGTGASGSTSGTSAGSISAHTASSGLNGVGVSGVGNYTGILENTSNVLATFGALASGLSTAFDAANALDGRTIPDNIADLLGLAKNKYHDWKAKRTQGRKAWETGEKFRLNGGGSTGHKF